MHSTGTCSRTHTAPAVDDDDESQLRGTTARAAAREVGSVAAGSRGGEGGGGEGGGGEGGGGEVGR